MLELLQAAARNQGLGAAMVCSAEVSVRTSRIHLGVSRSQLAACLLAACAVEHR